MGTTTIDLAALDRNVHQPTNRLLDNAFNIDDGGGMLNDVKAFGSEGATSFFWWDYSEDKCFIQRTTEDEDPGRLIYVQHLTSGVTAGHSAQGMQIRSRATGTGTITGGTDGAEIKAGLNSDSDTGTLAQARAVIANVDAKKGTITTAHMVEAQVDVGAGGTITTLKGFRASMNNSGTISTSYAFIVETANTSYNWDYGFYIANDQADVGMYLGNCTTGINVAGTSTTGISISGVASTAAISLTNQTSVCFVATTTLDSATEVIELTVDDASGIAAGRCRGVVVNYTISAAQSASAGTRVFAAEISLEEDTASFLGVDVSFATNTDNHTHGNVFGISVYIGDQGTTVSSLHCLDLGMVTTNAPLTRNLFIRCRNHGTIQSNSAVLGLEGNNAAWYFVDFSDSTELGCIMNQNYSGNTSDYAIRVKIGDLDRYITLHPNA